MHPKIEAFLRAIGVAPKFTPEEVQAADRLQAQLVTAAAGGEVWSIYKEVQRFARDNPGALAADVLPLLKTRFEAISTLRKEKGIYLGDLDA